MSRSAAMTLLTAALCLSPLSMGCSPEEDAYHEAQKQNTLESYESYLTEYPESKNTTLVEERLDDLYAEKAKREKTKESYMAYLERFPKGDNAPQIREGLEELEFNAARKSNTEEGWDTFLASFPKSNYSRKAKENKEKLSYRSKVEFGDIEISAINLAGDNRGPKDGFEVKGVATNTGEKTLSSLVVAVAPKGSAHEVQSPVAVEGGIAPGAEVPFTAKLSKVPEGWDENSVRLSAAAVSFGK